MVFSVASTFSQRRRQRSVVQHRGHLLPLVDGPPEKLDSASPSRSVCSFREQIGAGGDGRRPCRERPDGHAVVRRNLALLRRRTPCPGRLIHWPSRFLSSTMGSLFWLAYAELDVADGPSSVHGGGNSFVPLPRVRRQFHALPAPGRSSIPATPRQVVGEHRCRTDPSNGAPPDGGVRKLEAGCPARSRRGSTCRISQEDAGSVSDESRSEAGREGCRRRHAP